MLDLKSLIPFDLKSKQAPKQSDLPREPLMAGIILQP